MIQNDVISTAMKEGRAEGRAEGIDAANARSIQRMLTKGFTDEEIADLLGLPIEYVKSQQH